MYNIFHALYLMICDTVPATSNIKMKRVCVHHTQLQVDFGEQSSAQSIISTRSKTPANQPTNQSTVSAVV